MVARSTRNRRRFLCLDCGVDTGRIHEFYFVKSEIWLSVVGSRKGMLCVYCLEIRLGRWLTAADFTDASINDPRYGAKSQRLISRLNNGRPPTF